MKGRHANLDRIRALDPERDYVEIYQTTVRHEFPWDVRMGLNLAFIRTFSMPDVAAILVGTGELTERTQRRLDDTGLLMYEIVVHGFDHPRARASVRRINQMHRPYRHVPADEFVYVLACLAVLPMRWLDRYGWRKPCCHEREASFRFYRQLGELMNIPGLPGSLAEMEAWFDAYDRERLGPDDNAAAIERATRMRMRSRLPRALAPFGDAVAAAFYDPRLRAAVKVPAPPWPVRAGLHLGFKARAFVIRHLHRPRRVALFADGIVTTSHPGGYEVDELGPPGRRAGGPV